MDIQLFEIIYAHRDTGATEDREVSLGFVAASEFEAADKFCKHQNSLAMYNDESSFPHDYRLRPAVHPSLRFEDEVIVVDVFGDGRPFRSRTKKRTDAEAQHGSGVNAVVFDGVYREILQIIDGEEKAHWLARLEGVLVRGKAILKLQSDAKKAADAI